MKVGQAALHSLAWGGSKKKDHRKLACQGEELTDRHGGGGGGGEDGGVLRGRHGQPLQRGCYGTYKELGLQWHWHHGSQPGSVILFQPLYSKCLKNDSKIWYAKCASFYSLLFRWGPLRLWTLCLHWGKWRLQCLKMTWTPTSSGTSSMVQLADFFLIAKSFLVGCLWYFHVSNL